MYHWVFPPHTGAIFTPRHRQELIYEPLPAGLPAGGKNSVEDKQTPGFATLLLCENRDPVKIDDIAKGD